MQGNATFGLAPRSHHGCSQPMTVKPSPFAYEFRFFGASLDLERERLSAAGVAASTEDTSETYFISRLTIEASVKIRNEMLEIKELAERDGLLEGWVRAQSAALPVEGGLFLSEAAARLGLALDLNKDRLYSGEELIALSANVHALATRNVGKRRTIFDLEDMRGEFASVTVGDHIVDTIAFESPEAAPLMRLIEDLGFDQRVNESYPCYLQRLVFYGV